MRKFVFACFALVFFTACDSISGPEEGPLMVATSAATYVRSQEGVAEVSFSITNRGLRAVYVTRCGTDIAAAMEREGTSGWEQITSTVCFKSLDIGPALVLPKEALSGQVEVTEPGLYRLRVGTRTGAEGPFDWRTRSNEFRVE